jgi:hypothetical protein
MTTTLPGFTSPEQNLYYIVPFSQTIASPSKYSPSLPNFSNAASLPDFRKVGYFLSL